MKLVFVCAITFSPIVNSDRLRLVDTHLETVSKQNAIIRLIENMQKMPNLISQEEALKLLPVLLDELKKRSKSADMRTVKYFWLIRQG